MSALMENVYDLIQASFQLLKSQMAAWKICDDLYLIGSMSHVYFFFQAYLSLMTPTLRQIDSQTFYLSFFCQISCALSQMMKLIYVSQFPQGELLLSQSFACPRSKTLLQLQLLALYQTSHLLLSPNLLPATPSTTIFGALCVVLLVQLLSVFFSPPSCVDLSQPIFTLFFALVAPYQRQHLPQTCLF